MTEGFMSKFQWRAILGIVVLLMVAVGAQAQQRPYVGFGYPAGGQRGTTFRVTLGGQYLEGVNTAYVSGEGVTAKVVEYNKHLNPQEVMVLREQLDELKKGGTSGKDEETRKMIARLQKIVDDYILRPQSVSISNIAIIEVTVDANAKPSERELRVGTPRGLSNPLVFHVGQLPEVSLPPMSTSPLQVLGKEDESLTKRRRFLASQSSSSEMMMGGGSSQGGNLAGEVKIKVPCTVNGQIGSGEINRYRFTARKGQRLVISALGRQLIPYIADAVPGWFQPVLVVYDANGKEVAYDDDFRFKPDPVVLFDVPKDGEYVFAIYDGIYRGREDFVYRVTIGELPFVTSIFPLGGRVDTAVTVEMKGWNLPATRLSPPTKDVEPGIYPIGVRKEGVYSNRVLFHLDTLPECLEREPNNTPAAAQKVTLPIIINGRIDVPGDWDVFQFEGHAGETIIAQVYARRLDSPLDSVLKLTDASGKQLAYNDDNNTDYISSQWLDIDWGVNTHHADSYIRYTLPANGTYYLHIGDAQRAGGEEYAYRLRISAPQPDFAIRFAPSSVGFRGSSAAPLSVYVIRQDGFSGDITLALKDAPKGFSMYGATLSGTQQVVRVSLSTSLDKTEQPVSLTIEGRSTVQGKVVAHEAMPCEDRMQAFLWTHLVPAKEFLVTIPDPEDLPVRPKRTRTAKK